jgi:hypothetical protein
MAKMTYLWWYPEIKLKFVFVGPPAFSFAQFAGDFDNYANDIREIQPVRYDNLADNLKIDTIPLQIARFRGNNPQNTRVEFHARIPVDKLAAKAGVTSVPIETGLRIADAARAAQVDERDTVRVTAANAQPRTRSFSKQFRPGEYAYRVEALEAQSMLSARGAGVLSIGSFDESFAISDILLGTGLKNTSIRRRDELDMTPLAEMILEPGQQLGLYWEAYGAAKKDNAVNVQIEIAMTVLDLDRVDVAHVKLFGAIADRLGVSEEGKTLRFTPAPYTAPVLPGADDRIPFVLNMDLTGLPPARYVLEIRLTDLESKKTTHTSRVFHLRRPK